MNVIHRLCITGVTNYTGVIYRNKTGPRWSCSSDRGPDQGLVRSHVMVWNNHTPRAAL